MKDNKKKILPVLISLMLITSVIIILIANYNKKEPKLTTLEVFGEKIKVEEGKYIYDINITDAKISKLNNKCTKPFLVEFDKKNVKLDEKIYYKDGEYLAYYYFNVQDNNDNNKKTKTYDYGILVHFNGSPLMIEHGC